MSYALSQRRTDRHPVGLLIVVGLHVVLAAALLSAKLQRSPTIEQFIPLTSLEPVKPPPKPTEPPPPPPPRVLPRNVIVVPDDFKPDDQPPPRDVVLARVEPHVDQNPFTDSGPGPETPVHLPRVLAKAAHIDAGAAQCHPEYPAAAQRAGATGSTRIRFTVDALGRIAGSQILHASGSTRENRLMDQAAAAALAQCPVQVGTDDQGRPVGTTTDVEYVWSLN